MHLNGGSGSRCPCRRRELKGLKGSPQGGKACLRLRDAWETSDPAVARDGLGRWPQNGGALIASASSTPPSLRCSVGVKVQRDHSGALELRNRRRDEGEGGAARQGDDFQVRGQGVRRISCLISSVLSAVSPRLSSWFCSCASLPFSPGLLGCPDCTRPRGVFVLPLSCPLLLRFFFSASLSSRFWFYSTVSHQAPAEACPCFHAGFFRAHEAASLDSSAVCETPVLLLNRPGVAGITCGRRVSVRLCSGRRRWTGPLWCRGGVDGLGVVHEKLADGLCSARTNALVL